MRSRRYLRIVDGTVKHALSVIYPLREMPELQRFRVVQDEQCAVTIEVVADRANVTPDSVARAVRPVLGNEISLEVRLVNSLPVLESGKHQYVVSRATSVGPSNYRGEAS